MNSWPLIPLRDLLQSADNPVRVRQDARYPNFGIYSFGRGLFAKPGIEGLRTSAKTLYQVRAGDFIYSRLFAFEGSYGMVDDSFDGYFVSNEYPTFSIDRSRLEAGFLKAYFQLPSVWRAIATGSKGVGSRRIRVQPDKVLTHSIPLPSLGEQRTIVARRDGLITRTRQVVEHLDAVGHDAERVLALQFRKAIAGASMQRMTEVAPLVRRKVNIDEAGRYTELGVRSFYKGTFHRRTILGAQFSWQDIFTIRTGDLIFSNIMAWEQAIAIARSEDQCCVGNHRMLSCEVDTDKAIPQFLMYYFTTAEGFGKIYTASLGTAARNRTLTALALLSIDVPVPPLPIQLSFCRLQTAVATLRATHREMRDTIEVLAPAGLERTFSQTN
jgi:type I restriction enzyme, S subunit